MCKKFIANSCGPFVEQATNLGTASVANNVHFKKFQKKNRQLIYLLGFKPQSSGMTVTYANH